MKHAPQDAGIKEHYWQDKKKKRRKMSTIKIASKAVISLRATKSKFFGFSAGTM